jgi:zinc transport system ATP-binding protein
MQEQILEVKNLSVHFGDDTVLRDVSFSVEQGDTVAIIGPNGAGKTVLLKSLLGLIPHEGTVTWRAGVSIGYVPQRLGIERTVPITVREFFLLHEKSFLLSPRGADGKIVRALEAVELSKEILSRRLGALSGGQFQRILVAWAIYDRPEVLLFDEPTAGVDVGGEETIYNTLHGLQDRFGITILLVSHELNIVNRYATKVLCVNRTLTCQGTPEEALTPKELSKLFGEPTFYHHLHEYHDHGNSQ